MDETAIMLAAALTVALVQGAKQSGLPSRWSILASLLIGIAMAVLVGATGPRDILLDGIIAGLTASGLYSGTKAVASSGSPTQPASSARSVPPDPAV